MNDTWVVDAGREEEEEDKGSETKREETWEENHLLHLTSLLSLSLLSLQSLATRPFSLIHLETRQLVHDFSLAHTCTCSPSHLTWKSRQQFDLSASIVEFFPPPSAPITSGAWWFICFNNLHPSPDSHTCNESKVLSLCGISERREEKKTNPTQVMIVLRGDVSLFTHIALPVSPSRVKVVNSVTFFSLFFCCPFYLLVFSLFSPFTRLSLSVCASFII